MKRAKKYIRLMLDVLFVGTAGALLIVLRYMLKTPRPLQSVLPGEEYFYLWSHNNAAHKVYYKVSGPEDATPLVLLHAPEVGASSYEMRHIMADLAREYRVYAPDLLGFGLSEHPAIEYTAATYIALSTAFLEDVVGRPAVIVASGLSCNYSVVVAQKSPALCERLILLSPQELFKEPHQASRFASLLRIPALALVFYAALTLPFLLRAYEAQEHRVKYRRIAADELNYTLASAMQPGAHYAALAFLRGALNINVLTQFELLTQPLLLIQGALMQPLALPESIGQRQLVMPGGQPEQIKTIVLPDVSMRVHEERPAKVIAILLQDRSTPEAVTAQSAASTAPAYKHASSTEANFATDINNKVAPDSVDTITDYYAAHEISNETSVTQESDMADATMDATDEVQEPLSASERETEQLQESDMMESIMDVTDEVQEPLSTSERETEKLQELETLIERTAAYCVKCREKREMQNARRIVTKNGRNAMEGTCPVCSTRLFRFIAR